ncbi:hypothetical protein BP6252_00238 [Coleophoma cylindrospora]|uniref:PH domain-containing protein n=1 Tax=Coleophoma cylindrospora TaxID=1849047 RepID=A0A3D8SPI3_9HELO|nr:hypothetical protein BP6252_00238 [Coleophoma cylindrospora]
MSTDTDSASSGPQKFSRYRSVRQGKSNPPPTSMPAPKAQDAAVSRSMSRYHRARPTATEERSPAIPPTPHFPQKFQKQVSSDPRRRTAPTNSFEKRPVPARNLTDETILEAEKERRWRRAQEAIAREEQAYKARKEREEMERSLVQQSAAAATATPGAPMQLSEEETERILAETKRKDLERLEAELDAASPRIPSPKEKFGLFSRMKPTTKPAVPKSPGLGGLLPSFSKSSDPPARGIEPGGGGIVPGIDAPKSARILVRYQQSSITLPVNPDTTPKDLIYSAANIMSHKINPATAVILESYTKLGLERRVRRYEHIRDIMNSWDRDTQNALVLQNSDSPAHDRNTLEIFSVPREAPMDVSVVMYHSQKPGKWIKRHITLLSTGQIFISKKPGAKNSDKDVVNLCHLTDFDIYEPTPQQARKNLKPPRKFCYAIKSQQKTTIFLNTENFVHFFSTDSLEIADQWHSAVQTWRSWYLVHKKGDGQKKHATSSPQARLAAKTGPTRKSIDGDPYTIGSFKPLMRREEPKLHDDAEYDSEEENRPLQVPFHLRNASPRREDRSHPPIVQYRVSPPAEPSTKPNEFSEGGLLGRTYSLRQQAQREREKGPGANGEGQTPSHERTKSLSQRTKSMRRPEAARPETSGGLQRSPSKREKPAPLLDFTPKFVEPPQWNKAGKGHGVAAPVGVPLVEAATTPDMGPDDIPRTTTLLRREEHPAVARPTTARPPTSGGHRDREKAFVKGGLVEKIS